MICNHHLTDSEALMHLVPGFLTVPSIMAKADLRCGHRCSWNPAIFICFGFLVDPVGILRYAWFLK